MEIVEVYDFLAAQKWSGFAQSLAERMASGKELTEKQWAAAVSMKSKVERQESYLAKLQSNVEPRFASLAAIS